MPIEFYNDGEHKCVGFYDLVNNGDGVQSNQFLVVNGEHSALIDPGGDLVYNDLFMQSYKYLFTKSLEFVIGSHQDPDILSSLSKWLTSSNCKVIVPEVWARFMPHYVLPGKAYERIISIPDQGMIIHLGQAELAAIPAHFLHSEGNFQFYDKVAKILFSGDLGASLMHGNESEPVTDFKNHIQHMETFHQRYMSGNKVCRYWANMVRQLDIEWIIPQHGAPFRGREMVNKFIDWIEQLECGIDLMTQEQYTIPK